MEWKIEFSRAALKDAKKLKSANLESNVRELLQILKANPYEPPYEKLSGNLKGYLLFTADQHQASPCLFGQRGNQNSQGSFRLVTL